MTGSNTLLIALPFRGMKREITDALAAIDSIRISVRETQDFYGLKSVIRELDPAVVLTSPIILSDPLLPLFKEDLEMVGIRFVACCTSFAELQLLKNYDAKITLTDSPGEIEQLLEELLSRDETGATAEDPLTAREKEVVIAVVKGLTNKEIASRLFLSTHTVITHRKNIARKLDIHSPAGLTVYAIMNKLVDLEDIGE